MIKNIDTFLSSANKIKVSMKMVVFSICMFATFQAAAGTQDATLNEALQDRPVMENFIPGGGGLKVMEGSESNLSDGFNKLIGGYVSDKAVASQTLVMHGEALIIDKGTTKTVNDICFVTHAQNAHVTDGFYFYDTESFPAVFPKHLTDFFVKSHETGHCSFYYDAPESSNELTNNIYASLREVAADLAASIDYMRITGNNDLYHDLIRPMRLAGIGDHNHRTVWAMDQILKDIDPSVMTHQDANDVTEIVSILMQKHLLNEDGMTIDTKKTASKLMVSEIMADIDMTKGEIHYSDSVTVDKLKLDITNTLYGQIEGFRDSFSDEGDYLFHMQNFEDMVDKYDLPLPEKDNIEKNVLLEKSISNKSFAGYYLGR